MNLSKTFYTCVLSLGIFGVAGMATPINSAGVGAGGISSVTLNNISFASFGNTAGIFTVGNGTGDFAPYNGQNASIMNLTRVGDPVDTALNIPDFMVIPVGGNFHFVLTGITAGIHTDPTLCSALTNTQLATAGTACVTDPGSPFTLQNVSLPGGGGNVGTNVGLTATGYAYNTTTVGGTTPFQLSLSTQDNRSIAQLAAILGNGGTITDTYSGTITFTTTPEPASLALFGLGLTALGLLRRRQQRS